MGRKRTSIGIVYTPSSNWIGGVYYIQNLISALSLCSSHVLPEIKVFCNKDEEFCELKNITGYPFLSKRIINPQHGKFYNFLRYRFQKITGIIFEEPSNFPTHRDHVKFVYPMGSAFSGYDKTKILGWIPDFQEKYLPNLFSEKELQGRHNIQESYIKAQCPIVFSSEDAQKDFYKFHPDGENLKTFILPFAVTHPDYSHESIECLKERFDIRKQYLFCANQFWIHKNHLFLFKAFAEARRRGLDMQLVCSGKMHDYRNTEYSNELKTFIAENHLENDIRLVGFLERTEQLCLMKNCYALIQPSLFEGWSTVVEDAKCLNKFIFLSNLQVHIEQAPTNVCYFDPHNEIDLVDKLLTIRPTETKVDYKQNVKAFGERFLQIIRDF